MYLLGTRLSVSLGYEAEYIFANKIESILLCHICNAHAHLRHHLHSLACTRSYFHHANQYWTEHVGAYVDLYNGAFVFMIMLYVMSDEIICVYVFKCEFWC